MSSCTKDGFWTDSDRLVASSKGEGSKSSPTSISKPEPALGAGPLVFNPDT